MSGEIDRRSDEGSRELVNTGADLAGALIGGAVGMPLGPPGAIVGGAVGVVVQHGIRNVVGRLSRREEERVGAAVLLLEDGVRRRGEQGGVPRDDGFFDDRGRLRPEAEDLLEEILRQAAESADERRIPLMARLYAAISFTEAVSAADAKFLVRVASGLTYRQFVALAVYAHHAEHEMAFAEMEALQEAGESVADPGIALELKELIDLRLLGGTADGGNLLEIGDPLAGNVVGGAITYGQLRLLPTGERLVEMAGVGDIGPHDRETWVTELTGKRRSQ